ncbi:Cytochrome p-450 [Cladophialophora chaetospira]|uniref:Cytochrome p-450 n=1 Tax=Cladophialophora chaetospira TaxID=386627 RepID=A0AA39CFE9_9EURO|nr:Cytochrome p-450 [Cladophialophora chaetospira]
MEPVYYLGIGILACYLIDCFRTALRPGLRSLPGPLSARFFRFYRSSLVFGGTAPEEYRKVHEQYGPIVRVGPNHVSIADPSAIPVIYGIGTGSKFLKTNFYNTMSPFYQGTVMPSVFTERDPDVHRNLKRPVAQLFSMTNMRNYEPYADQCTSIFIDAMRDLEGQPIDLGAWVQWYAFDVIACMTFQRRFGFLEQRRDIDSMIGDLDAVLHYVKIIGQYPELHPHLLGNETLVRTLKWLFPQLPDPLYRFLKITEDEIARYDDQQGEKTGRTDFLAQLREKESKDGQIPYRDMMNHLSNNIVECHGIRSDTTAVSLRACFYYLIKTPSAYEKLVAEIDEAEKTGKLSNFISYEECLRLPYLQAVLKEAMRLHPGVAYPLERYVPVEGATICGVELPGGTNVSVTAPVIHMDKTVYGEDAESFRPERWLEAEPEHLKLMERSFLTFGAGTRTCIGKNISILEMGKFVPQILRHFDLEWASALLEWKTEAVWFWKQSGIIVRFKWRGKC